MKETTKILMELLDVQNPRRCWLCQMGPGTEWHHVFMGPNRRLAEEDGLKVLLCADCHRNGQNAAHRDPATKHMLEYYGKQAYLIKHTPEEFRQRYGRNYDNDASVPGEP